MTDVLVANGGSTTFAARKGNKIKNLTTGQVFELDASYLLSSAAVADGTTPGKAKSAATTTGVALGGTLTKAAIDDLWDLTGVSTGTGEYRKVALIIKSGNTADIIVGDIGASQAAAPLPPLAKYCGTTATSFAVIVAGVVEIPPSFSGGDLSGFVFYDLPGYYPF